LEATADGPEDVVGTDGGLAACRVVIEGDKDACLVKIGGAAECGGLSAGQGRAAGSQSGVLVWIGQGHGDRVEWPFHDDRNGAASEVTARVVKPE
jgi:hypothetical protein